MPMWLIYLITVNALGFAFMHADKQKARKGAWRIPEKVLLSIALIGSSMGCISGMRLFRHKTRHPLFSVGLPVILSIQIIGVIFVYCLFFASHPG